MYTVLKQFRDVTDNDHIYNVGEVYPHEDCEPSTERVAELLSNDGIHRAAPLKGSPLIAPTMNENIEEMTAKELQNFLSSHKVDFKKTAKKPELLKLAKSVSGD